MHCVLYTLPHLTLGGSLGWTHPAPATQWLKNNKLIKQHQGILLKDLPTNSYMKGKVLRTCRETRGVFESLASGQGCANTAVTGSACNSGSLRKKQKPEEILQQAYFRNAFQKIITQMTVYWGLARNRVLHIFWARGQRCHISKRWFWVMKSNL